MVEMRLLVASGAQSKLAAWVDGFETGGAGTCRPSHLAKSQKHVGRKENHNEWSMWLEVVEDERSDRLTNADFWSVGSVRKLRVPPCNP